MGPGRRRAFVVRRIQIFIETHCVLILDPRRTSAVHEITQAAVERVLLGLGHLANKVVHVPRVLVEVVPLVWEKKVK